MARLLDLTRLVSRLGRGPMTGVDRVEFAYLTRLLAGETPLFALVRTRLGFVLLDRAGAQGVADRAAGQALGKVDWIGRLIWRGDALRARAEADVRRLAAGRATRLGLGRLLRHLPVGFVYYNVGHANLAARVMRAVKAAGGKVAVLVHDTIPLDHPEFTRPGIAQVFARKMAVVSGFADLVIHTTRDARGKTEGHLARMGRCPAGLVSRLGVGVTPPDVRPEGLAARYFVALGTIEPRKNHALLLEVWARGKGLPKLYIVGTKGWAEPGLFARIAATPGVEVLSGLTDGAVTALLAGAEALLWPSFAEGFGLPPLEAAALGVPVIASDLSVTRELMGDYPVYLDATDAYSWLETITALGQRPGPRRERAGQIDLPTWDDHFNLVFNFG